MVFLIPSDRMSVVIDRDWDIGAVVHAGGLGRIIRSPNHIDHAGLYVGVGLEVVEHHLQMDILSGSRELAATHPGFRRRSQHNHGNACAKRNYRGTSEHRTPPVSKE